MLALPSAAAATPPTREPAPLDTTVFPAGQVCEFPLQVDPLKNGEKITTFSDGRMRITGSLFLQLTNLDNGRSLSLNASGPSELDTSVGLGAGLVFLFPGDVGGPAAYLFHGRVVQVFDDQGVIVSLTYSGKRSDNLCDALA